MSFLSKARDLVPVGRKRPPAEQPDAQAPALAGSTGSVPEVIARRRATARRHILQIAAATLIPTLIATVYYGFVASDRYVSETHLVVEDGQAANPMMGLIGSLIGGGSGLGNSKSQMLFEYIRSGEMLNKLQAELDLRAKWSDPRIDYFSRLSADASREEFLEYYRTRVNVVADQLSPLIKVQVASFSPEDAQAIARSITAFAEVELNGFSSESRSDTVAFARQEIQEAEKRLAQAQTAINTFRIRHGEFDPQKSAEVVGGIMASITGQVAQKQAEMESLLAYMRPDSPQIMSLKAQIAALENQVKRGQTTLAGAQDAKYPDLIAEYQNLLIEERFATEAYGSALAFLESARAEMQRQHGYVTAFVAPSLPETSTEPYRFQNVLLVFLVSLLSYLIISLIASAIREQARL